MRLCWTRGQTVVVHGWVYGLHNGLLEDLKLTAASADQVGLSYDTALALVKQRYRQQQGNDRRAGGHVPAPPERHARLRHRAGDAGGLQPPLPAVPGDQRRRQAQQYVVKAPQQKNYQLLEILKDKHKATWDKVACYRTRGGRQRRHVLYRRTKSTVLGPAHEQLVKLRERWDDVIEEFGAAEDAEDNGEEPPGLHQSHTAYQVLY